VCFGMTGSVLCRSPDVRRVEDAGSVLNPGGKQNGGEGGKEGYMYS